MSKDDAPTVDRSRKVSPLLPETVGRVRSSLNRAIEEKRRRKQMKASGVGEAAYATQKVVVPGTAKPKAKDLDDDIFSGAGGFDGAAEAAKAVKEKEKAQAQAQARAQAAAGKSSSSSSSAKKPATTPTPAGKER